MLAIVNTLSSTVNKVGFWTRRHAPEILVVGGLVGGVATTVLACRATLQAAEDIGEAQAEIEAIEETKKTKDTYTEEEYKKDKRRVYSRLGFQMVKRYAIPAATGLASMAAIGAGTGILNKRNASLAMGLASTTASLKDIKNNLINKYGEEEGKKLYNELRYGLKEEEVKEQIVDEDGKKRTIKKKIAVADENAMVRDVSYVRKFDWHNPYWQPNMQYNLMFARSQQNYANDKFRADGHYWTDDADKALGFKSRKEGRTTGWHYDPKDPTIDNFVDFNIQEAWEHDEDGTLRPVLYFEYNVDGSILNKINWDS